MQTTMESLENEQTYLSQKVSTLKRDLKSAPSKEQMNTIMRELRILKKIEYNVGDNDNDDKEILIMRMIIWKQS